jgi:hypothetical protein
MGEHTNTIKRNTEAILEANRVVGLEVNTEKIFKTKSFTCCFI